MSDESTDLPLQGNITDITKLRGWNGPEDTMSSSGPSNDEDVLFTTETSGALARNVVNLLGNPNGLRDLLEANGLVSSRLVSTKGGKHIEGMGFQDLQKSSLDGKSFMEELIVGLDNNLRYTAIFPDAPSIDEHDFINRAIVLLIVDRESKQVVMEIKASYIEDEQLNVPVSAIDPHDVSWEHEIYEIDIHGSFSRRRFGTIRGTNHKG